MTIRRVFGAILLLPVVVVVWYDQKNWQFNVVMLLALLMSLEAKRMTNMPPSIGYLVVGLILLQSIPHWVIDRPVTFIHWGVLLVAAVVLVNTKKNIVALFFGLLSLLLALPAYCFCNPLAISCLLCSLLLLPAAIALPILLAGRLGGPKLWPRISPSKTISGSIGGLVASVGLTIVLADVFGFADRRDALILGFGLGVLAQSGDLLESAIKRCSNVKDGGSILPGHGGMLDRFDGYIYNYSCLLLIFI